MRKGIEKLGRKAPHPHVVLAHSMGGAIALEAMRTRQVEVEAAAFSSPMWGIPIWFFQRWYARGVRFFGFGGVFARPPQPEETFATNQLTHDEARWRVYRNLIAAEPKLAVGEPTVGWVVATLNVLRELHDASALDHIRRMPIMIAQAAEDTIVRNAAQRRVARRLKDAKLVVVEGSGHEILMETDARREKFWKAFDEMCKRAGI
jgi:lysophospholipase